MKPLSSPIFAAAIGVSALIHAGAVRAQGALGQGVVATDSAEERRVLPPLVRLDQDFDPARDSLSLAYIPIEWKPDPDVVVVQEPGDGELPNGTGLFVLLRGKVHRVDPRHAEVWEPYDAPEGTVAITKVGALIGAVPATWSGGKDAIALIDPIEERVVGEIGPAKGVARDHKALRVVDAAVSGGALCVLLEQGVIYRVDPRNGKADRVDVEGSENAVGLFACDAGLGVVEGLPKQSGETEPRATGLRVLRSGGDGGGGGKRSGDLFLACYRQPSSVAVYQGQVFLGFPDGVFEASATERRERVVLYLVLRDEGREVPDIMAPGTQRMIGRKVAWHLGAKTLERADDLVAAGEAMAREYRRSRQWDDNRHEADGKVPLMQVVVSAGPKVNDEEVADAIELMRLAGYTEIFRAPR